MTALEKRILYLGLDPARYQGKGEITHCPLIQILPRPFKEPTIQLALEDFFHYSHLIITSKSTVSILLDYLSQMNISLTEWKIKKTIAVGTATADQLIQCGIIPFRIAKEETAEGIVEELSHLSLADAYLFWPHSSQARPLISTYLAGRSIRFTSCALYDPLPFKPDPLPALEDFDEIVFTSPSVVQAFVAYYREFPSHATLSPIGSVTKQALTAAKSKAHSVQRSNNQ